MRRHLQAVLRQDLPAWLVAVPAALLAVLSLRYLLPHPPAAPLNITQNPFARPWLPIHAALSSIALLLGAGQVLVGRDRNRQWHRRGGWVYVICCLLSAPVGLLLALGATTGPIATAGFGSLSLVWFVTTLLGYRAAVDRRVEAHRRWMLRSYALTFGAVTLRLYLTIALLLRLDFDIAYRAISFLAWVPNLVVVELLLRRSRRGTPRSVAP